MSPGLRLKVVLLLVASKVGAMGGGILSSPSLIVICFKETTVFPFGFVHFILLHNFIWASCNMVKTIYPTLTETLFGEEATRCGKITSGSARVPGESLAAQKLAET